MLPRRCDAERAPDGEPRYEPVFVETVAAPGTGEPQPLASLDRGQTRLGIECCEIEHRMPIVETRDHAFGLRFHERIERDEDRPLGLEAL